MQTLKQILDNISEADREKFKRQVPGFIYSNLKNGFGQRPYQQEAFGRFVYYWNEHRNKISDKPAHLLYHMATGSGKTVIMAGLIIFLYEMGYRHFLFFVNSTNIIDKTKDNFFNIASSKYLFANHISINGKNIKIVQAENFQSAGKSDITIVFSTIQGLHSKLNMPSENSLTYEDLEDNNLVLISDEAHHINAETKKGKELTVDEHTEIKSWESTVGKILSLNADNVLLEFTATVDFTFPEIKKKYAGKLLYDYSLKQFRKDGYSKDVKVLQSGMPVADRVLQAIIISQYRRKLFEKYKQPVKPVILFKSKTIRESHLFLEMFQAQIHNLTALDIEKIKSNDAGNPVGKAFNYLEQHNVSLQNFVQELKHDFSDEKLISINSKDESVLKQLVINSLEDEHNNYRAVFAVDKLNEGWDVLNLFDIVRLYDIKEISTGSQAKTTMAEAQLIGRGARYCPFQINQTQHRFIRKYDDDIDNELRICEELYYHSVYNPQYINELNTALEHVGIREQLSAPAPGQNDQPEIKRVTNHIDVEKHTDVFKELQGKPIQVTLKTGISISTNIFETTGLKSEKLSVKRLALSDFHVQIIRKAMSRLDQYHFCNLKQKFPALSSVSEFISSANYMGNLQLSISAMPDHLHSLSADDKQEAVTLLLEKLSHYF